MKFLEERPKDVNQSLLAISRKVIVDGAIEQRLIQDDDLAFIPEVLPLLVNLAMKLRTSKDNFSMMHNHTLRGACHDKSAKRYQQEAARSFLRRPDQKCFQSLPILWNRQAEFLRVEESLCKKG